MDSHKIKDSTPLRIYTKKEYNRKRSDSIDSYSLTSSFGLLSYATNHDLEGEVSDEIRPKKSILSIIYKFLKNL